MLRFSDRSNSVPCGKLIEDMQLRQLDADGFYFDLEGKLAAFDADFVQGINSVIIRKDMFTSNQGDLSVYYYDPESGRVRQYYPDFLAKKADGSYELIEVKGDNKIDSALVLAKQAAAEEMAVASGIKYMMYPSSVIMKTNVLEEANRQQQSFT